MTRFSADVFIFILVAILCGEKCYSLSDDEFIANTRHEVLHLNQNIPAHNPIRWRHLKRIPHHALALGRFGHRTPVQDLLTKLDTAHPRKPISNVLRRRHLLHQGRLARQAYGGYQQNLYPSLPTSPLSYPYQPQHNPQFVQPNPTPPYNPQWQPHGVQNFSKPGYPGYTPSSNNSYNHGNQSPYNPNYTPYNPTPSAPVTPRPPPYNNNFGPGYPNQYPNNFNNSVPQNRPGNQPYSSSQHSNNYYPGFQPSYGVGNNTSVYNPSPRPPYYPSGNNSFNPHQPNYSPYTTPRIPNTFPNQYGTYNYSQTGFPTFRPGSVPSNTSFVNYPGYPNRPLPNGPPGPIPRPPGSGHHNGSFNGYPHNNNYNIPVNNFNNQGQPIYPGQNNFANPNPGSGYYGHTNQNIPTSSPYGQINGQLPGMFYPQNQYNRTSTYRLADHYTPNIPSQPKPNYGGNNSFYPSNPTHDPTRVPPERFSY